MYFPMEGSCLERSSALLVTRVHEDYWALHFVGRKLPGEKVYSIGCAIHIVKNPENLEKWCNDFHRAFALATQRILSTPDAPWDIMHNFSEDELCAKFNEVYRSMWQVGIEPGQPPKKLRLEMRKFFSMLQRNGELKGLFPRGLR